MCLVRSTILAALLGTLLSARQPQKIASPRFAPPAPWRPIARPARKAPAAGVRSRCEAGGARGTQADPRSARPAARRKKLVVPCAADASHSLGAAGGLRQNPTLAISRYRDHPRSRRRSCCWMKSPGRTPPQNPPQETRPTFGGSVPRAFRSAAADNPGLPPGGGQPRVSLLASRR